MVETSLPHCQHSAMASWSSIPFLCSRLDKRVRQIQKAATETLKRFIVLDCCDCAIASVFQFSLCPRNSTVFAATVCGSNSLTFLNDAGNISIVAVYSATALLWTFCCLLVALSACAARAHISWLIWISAVCAHILWFWFCSCRSLQAAALPHTIQFSISICQFQFI